MKKIISTLLCLLLTSSLFAQEISIHDRIKTEDFYRKVYPSVFGLPDFGLAKDFKKTVRALPEKKKEEVLAAVKELQDLIPENVLRPLIYWRYIDPQPIKEKEVLQFLLLNKLLVLRDAIDNPLNPEPMEALEVLKNVTGRYNVTSLNLFGLVEKDLETRAAMLSQADHQSFVANLQRDSIISLDIEKTLPGVSPYSLSYQGLIPGNIVQVVSENRRDLDRIEWLNQHVIFNGGTLDFNAPFIKMPTEKDPIGHPIFMQDPIYIKIKDMITKAEDSIFIDIFLFGGTLGATLSEYFIDQIKLKKQINPGFKALLLHDYATNYNMKDEMMPIFAYIKNRISTEPDLKDSVFLLQANIQRHPPGVPFRLTNLIPKTDDVFKEIEKRNTYYESKIDHSKVIVIDANTAHPAAYFGSKNWTDHSGGYYYDDAIYIEGPAAALVQASYFKDIDAALTENPNELRWFFYKEEGYDNVRYLPKKKEILDWFKIKRATYPAVGSEKVRIAEADVDGTVKNVRNILIDMIKNAQKTIYMEELFIYDNYINDALMKRKIEHPDLEVKIIADHNGNFGMNGIPNTAYVKELQSYGIEVRARKTYGIVAKFPNGKEQSYHQENHRKIASVDGKVLLGGSSNLNPDTLQGSFREFGAQIYDKREIARFEANFLRDWNDGEKVADLDIENFQARVGGKLFSKDISALINNVISQLFRSKDKLERRY